jgi:TetR/AcrR family transcriptional regulator
MESLWKTCKHLHFLYLQKNDCIQKKIDVLLGGTLNRSVCENQNYNHLRNHMTDNMQASENNADVEAAEQKLALARKRPKPGERRVQILEALATMLEGSGNERITTAALATRLDVSEAALYRHFASKAQMFEALIEFIEQTVFSLINQITEREPNPQAQVARILALTLQFAEKNPGMARVMVGDALVFENERLQQRMTQFFDRFESSLKQSLRAAAEAQNSATPTVDAQVKASVLTAFVVGRLQRFTRSGFKRLPSEHLEASFAQLL